MRHLITNVKMMKMSSFSLHSCLLIQTIYQTGHDEVKPTGGICLTVPGYGQQVSQ